MELLKDEHHPLTSDSVHSDNNLRNAASPNANSHSNSGNSVCESHPGFQLDINCLNCDTIICSQCKISFLHDTHKTESIDEAVRKCCEKVQPTLHETEGKLENKSHRIEFISKQSVAIRSNQKLTKAQLQAHKDNIIHEISAAINKKFEKLVDEIDVTANSQTIKLESIKKEMELEMKAGENVLNWIKAIKTNASGPNFLREFQTGLTERLQDMHNHEKKHAINETISLSQFMPSEPKIPTFHLGTLKTQTEKMAESPILPKKKHASNLHYRKVQTNLGILSSKIGRVEKTVTIGTDALRLCVFQENLWIPSPSTNSINIFPIESDAESVETIMDLGEVVRPHSLHPLGQETLVLAADSGLYVLNDKGHVKDKVHNGKFCDVFVNKSQVAALEWGEKKLYTWSKDNFSSIQTSFEVPLASNNIASTICVHNAYIFVSDCARNVIMKFNTQGILVQEFGISGNEEPGELNLPNICAIDPPGDVLVADSGNHRLQVLSGSGKWSVTKMRIFKPRDVVIIRSTMYVLHSEGNKISMYPL